MHTLSTNRDGTYDVIFMREVNIRIVISTRLDFETAIRYVNILNGGSGMFDNKTTPSASG